MNRYTRTVSLSILTLSALASNGCRRDNATGTTQTTSATTPIDNTGVNAHDFNGVPTPFDQGSDPADMEMTQRIRQALMADDALSSDAKNVMVITKDGHVTLRGTVRSLAERANIESKAMQFAGTNQVDDALDVESTR